MPAALIAILLEAPQLLKSAAQVWQLIMGAHAIGMIKIPDEQLAALKKLSFQLDADIQAMLDAKPVGSAAGAPPPALHFGGT